MPSKREDGKGNQGWFVGKTVNKISETNWQQYQNYCDQQFFSQPSRKCKLKKRKQKGSGKIGNKKGKKKKLFKYHIPFQNFFNNISRINMGWTIHCGKPSGIQ